MKCPICNNEMETGYVESARTVRFTKGKNSLFIIPEKDDVVITKNNWTGPSTEAFCCRECKHIIVKYD